MDTAQAEIFAASLTGKVVGGWSVGEKIGAGKSAVVLRAIKNGKTGALKVFHPELVERYGQDTQLARIDRERSLIGVKHENIVEILDGGKCEETNHLFVVMEYLAFRNLRQALLEVPNENIKGIIEQLASAARFLEDRGLAHRDIKPENIGISENFKTIVLFDLGVLRPFADANLTDVDQRAFIGTLRYSSPEFLQRKEEDSATGWRAVSIYQIGAVLHDLLMKCEIFNNFSTPFAILVQAVIEREPEIYGADVELVRLAKHCLVKNPQTRLELVGWSNFVEKTDSSNQVDNLRAKIHARQKFFNTSSQEKILGGELHRIQKRLLIDFCNDVNSQIGRILNNSEYFPFRKTIQEVNGENLSATLLIIFEKSQPLGVDTHICVNLRIQHRDDNNGSTVYAIEGGAALSSSELESHEIRVSQSLFAGVVKDLSVTSSLENFFLNSLEAAYEYFEKNGIPPKECFEIKTIGE